MPDGNSRRVGQEMQAQSRGEQSIGLDTNRLGPGVTGLVCSVRFVFLPQWKPRICRLSGADDMHKLLRSQ